MSQSTMEKVWYMRIENGSVVHFLWVSTWLSVSLGALVFVVYTEHLQMAMTVQCGL